MDTAIEQIAKQAIEERIFPGVVIGFINDGESTVLPFGNFTYEVDSEKVSADTVYDLASITKVIPTNSIILSLIENGLLSGDDRVVKFIPEIKNQYRDKMLIKHLMTFTILFDLKDRLTSFAENGAEGILNAIFKAPLKYPPGQTYHYSNAPIILLGMIAERILEKSLDEIAEEMFFKPLIMSNTTFHPEKLSQKNIAPTEIDERGEVRGIVHDETAWALYKDGFIAGHAGLFSTADDLLTYGQMILAEGKYRGRKFFNPQTIKRMGTEVLNNSKFGMSLGWEMNQSDYMSPYISKNVFGKDGFTGTLFLIDPDRKKCLVILSNRTYPKRPESSEAINKVRQRIEEIILG